MLSLASLEVDHAQEVMELSYFQENGGRVLYKEHKKYIVSFQAVYVEQQLKTDFSINYRRWLLAKRAIYALFIVEPSNACNVI